jgi:hypothetical protein
VNDDNGQSDERFLIAGPNFGANRVTANEGLQECQNVLSQGEDQDLYSPQSGQVPQTPSCKWPTIPEGTIIRQPANSERQTVVDLADNCCRIVKRKDPITITGAPSRSPTEKERQAFEKIWAQIDEAGAKEKTEKAERRGWGFPETGSVGVFTFQQVLADECAWCRFRIKHQLVKFCERNGYPSHFIASEKITQVGFEKLCAQEQATRRDQNTKSKRKKRDQARAANQVPERNEGLIIERIKSRSRKKC